MRRPREETREPPRSGATQRRDLRSISAYRGRRYASPEGHAPCTPASTRTTGVPLTVHCKNCDYPLWNIAARVRHVIRPVPDGRSAQHVYGGPVGRRDDPRPGREPQPVEPLSPGPDDGLNRPVLEPVPPRLRSVPSLPRLQARFKPPITIRRSGVPGAAQAANGEKQMNLAKLSKRVTQELDNALSDDMSTVERPGML